VIIAAIARRIIVAPEVEMAQRVTVALEDDLDGGAADETVRFGFDGTDYEIDLSGKHAGSLRKQLAPFIGHAREVGRGPSRRAARTAVGRQQSRNIRASCGQ
jgi:hypothetical protein